MEKKKFDSGLQKLSPEKKELLKKRMAKASNKSDEWKKAKKDAEFTEWDGSPMLKGSFSTVKDQLIKLGVLPEADPPLPYKSVDEYISYKKEQDSLQKEQRDKHLAVPSHCPPPTEGVYATIKGFNVLAATDRQELLRRASEAAAEERRSELPSMYVHGLAMSWSQLLTLMEASGFELTRTEENTSGSGDGSKSREKFEDIMRSEDDHDTNEGKNSSQINEDMTIFNLDMIRNDVDRRSISLSGKMREDLDSFAKGILSKGIYNKARYSVLIECLLRIGLITAQKRIQDGILEFRIDQTVSNKAEKSLT